METISEDLKTDIDMFRHAIDLGRSELSSRHVIEEETTYKYAIIRVYSRALLTACEIYTLITAGYPEGALSLSRSIYEAMVITSKLIDGKKKQDNEMLERFLVSPRISRLQKAIRETKWILSQKSEDSEILQIQDKLLNELSEIKAQYGINPQRENLDYWWSGNTSFANLEQNTVYKNSPIYVRTCGNVHFNTYSIFTYADDSTDDILIGETYSGIVLPLLYASICLFEIARMIHEEYPEIASQRLIYEFKNVSDYATEINKRRLIENSKVIRH